MCNVAGYLGKRPAAPALLEMLEREEGFAGGYYTGIATVADGELHCEKVVGDVATLCRETDAEKLPGTVGIAHSRSKSGGDREWAHPFVDCDERMAYIANGHAGFFEDKRRASAIATRLAAAGHRFRARVSEPIGSYPVLADGTCVHTSEVMCHLIQSLVGECRGQIEAMRKAFMGFPAEIVGLMVHADTPDCVVASRINQPLVIGRAAYATYLATTPLAFPDSDTEWLTPMPVNSTAAVYRERVHILPFDPPPGKVADLLPCAAGSERMLELLADRKAHGVQAFKDATAPLWPGDAAPQKDMMVYEILRGLYREGRICFETVRVPGVLEGSAAPRKLARRVPT